MKRALLALFLVASPAFAQANGWAEMANGWGEIQTVPGFTTIPPPSSATLGCVGVFLGSPLNLQCYAGLSYDAATDTLTTNTYRGRTARLSAAPAVTITTCTNATPPVCTATAHGLNTGDVVGISGVTGLTAANGLRLVTRLSADTFSLQDMTGADVVGNGAFGGTATVTTGIAVANRVLVGDGTAAAPGLASALNPTSGLWFTASGSPILGAGSTAQVAASNGVRVASTGVIGFASGTADGTAHDTFLTRGAAATLQLGAANAASPVAQVLKFQDATGTNANAAATATVKCPAGTGTGTPGACVFQAPVGGSSGSTAHTQTDALKIIGAASGGVPGVVLAATQSPASNAACTAGTITWDASYIYICTASGAWKRAALTGGY